MTDNAPPSSNPANLGSLAGTFQVVLDKFARQLDNMIPARVQSFDRETNRAVVVPMVMLVTTNNEQVERSQVVDVPVFQPSGGGFVINFPLNPGDLGWLHASDRDISIFKQSYGSSRPNTFRKHTFEDGVFYPDTMRGWVISDEGLVIQTLSGNQKINVREDLIQIFSDTEVKINAPHVTIDSPLTTITGELETGTDGGGEARFGGAVNAVGDVTTDQAGGISLATHRHNGVQTGGGNTGNPIP